MTGKLTAQEKGATGRATLLLGWDSKVRNTRRSKMGQSHVIQPSWTSGIIAVFIIISLAFSSREYLLADTPSARTVIQPTDVPSVVNQLFSALQQDALSAAINWNNNQFPGNHCPTSLPGPASPLQHYATWLSQVKSQIAAGSSPAPYDAIQTASTAAANDLAPFAQDWVPPPPPNSTDVNAQRGAAADEAKVARRLTQELSGAWTGLVSAFSNQDPDVKAAAVTYLSSGPMVPSCVTVLP
ncbi:MAG TPA: hypothetical protein VNX02_05565 [Steroidobacteraceae bacterium]|jgi:hypothetical protein|nr:hypothetical protein [Steroidobacteraceae bacterium]